MDDVERNILFETYKLHAELAERVAVLREGVNKLYVGIVVSVLAASVLVYRLAPDTETVWVLPSLGLLVSVSWIVSLQSVTGRLSAKHNVLVALEAELPFRFFELEKIEFEKQRFFRRKYSGLVMPSAFLFSCVAWLLFLLNPCG